MQGASHGRIVSVADVTIDRNTREVVRDQTSAFNQIVTHDISPDPDIQALADRAWSEASDSAQRPVGTITADLTRDRVPSGESTLGNLVADAQLAAGSTRGAQLALTNPGGMREDLDFGTSGQVTYRQAYGVQPFGNSLEVLSVTGAVLKDALEQQFQIDLDGTATERILSPSAGFTYALDRRAAPGARISEMRLNRAGHRARRRLQRRGEQVPRRGRGRLHRTEELHPDDRCRQRPRRLDSPVRSRVAGLATCHRPHPHHRLTRHPRARLPSLDG